MEILKHFKHQLKTRLKQVGPGFKVYFKYTNSNLNRNIKCKNNNLSCVGPCTKTLYVHIRSFFKRIEKTL